jgi:hypothetical protein
VILRRVRAPRNDVSCARTGGQRQPVKIHVYVRLWLPSIFYLFEDFTMSAPAPHATDHHATEVDGVEAIVPLMPIVLPFVGAVTMLLIAFIAVFMA